MQKLMWWRRRDDTDPRLREMTLPELYQEIAGWKEGSAGRVAADDELRRRRETPTARRAWWAISISALSLLVALGALFVAAAK